MQNPLASHQPSYLNAFGIEMSEGRKYILRIKGEALAIYKAFAIWVQTQHGIRIKYLCSDCGGEPQSRTVLVGSPNFNRIDTNSTHTHRRHRIYLAREGDLRDRTVERYIEGGSLTDVVTLQ